MNKIIAIIMLATFPPMQLYAAAPDSFSSDTQINYFVPRDPDKVQENDKKLNEKMLEAPPKTVDEENSGINWKLWGGVGLLAVAGGIIAVVLGGSKGGSNSSPGSNVAPTTAVNASW